MIAPLKIIIEPDKIKTRSLFSESQTTCGTKPINPAKLAPSPIETNKLGKAQQIIVPNDVNKER